METLDIIDIQFLVELFWFFKKKVLCFSSFFKDFETGSLIFFQIDSIFLYVCLKREQNEIVKIHFIFIVNKAKSGLFY